MAKRDSFSDTFRSEESYKLPDVNKHRTLIQDDSDCDENKVL